MFTKRIGNVVVHFEPLIVVIITSLIAFLIISLLLHYREKKVTKSFESGNYSAVLVDGKKLLKTYQGYAKRYKHPNTLSWIEYLHFAMAVSYFSVENYEQFLYHINAFNQNRDIKEFWLSLYYLRQKDFNSFQEHYENIKVSDETLKNRTYLDSLKLYMDNEYDMAKWKMNEIYENLNHPVLKQIADEVLKSKN